MPMPDWQNLVVMFFDQGLVVEDAPPNALFNNPQEDRTKLFLSQILHH